MNIETQKINLVQEILGLESERMVLYVREFLDQLYKDEVLRSKLEEAVAKSEEDIKNDKTYTIEQVRQEIKGRLNA